jgi:hypothetical protein
MKEKAEREKTVSVTVVSKFLSAKLNKKVVVKERCYQVLLIPSPLLSTNSRLISQVYSIRRRRNRLFFSPANSFLGIVLGRSAGIFQQLFFSTRRCGQPVGQLANLSGAEGGGAGANKGKGVPEGGGAGAYRGQGVPEEE